MLVELENFFLFEDYQDKRRVCEILLFFLFVWKFLLDEMDVDFAFHYLFPCVICGKEVVHVLIYFEQEGLHGLYGLLVKEVEIHVFVEEGYEAKQIPNWNRAFSAVPDLANRLKDVIEEDNA